MPNDIQLTGLAGEATLLGRDLVCIVFQLSAAPVQAWAAIFNRLAKQLAQQQNHGIRPGFRFSYRLDGDTIRVKCPTASFTTLVKGKNVVVEALMGLVANANLAADQAEADLLDREALASGSGASASTQAAEASK